MGKFVGNITKVAVKLQVGSKVFKFSSAQAAGSAQAEWDRNKVAWTEVK